MQTVTTNSGAMFYDGCVIRMGHRRLIIESVDSATTFTTRRPMLGHYIAWAVLGLWHSIFSR